MSKRANSKVIIADTGPLIALGITGLLPALRQFFPKILIPQTVFKEATKDEFRLGANSIIKATKEGWIKVVPIELSETYQVLIDVLDKGEAEALALAKNLNATALIDERKGRIIAVKHNIKITGSAAILIKAKQEKLISEVKPLLEQLTKHGYRLSDNLIDKVLEIAGEKAS